MKFCSCFYLTYNAGHELCVTDSCGHTNSDPEHHLVSANVYAKVARLASH